MSLATLLRLVQDQCMCAPVPNRGEGNQRRPGLVFCVFIGERAGQNRKAEEKFAASATPGGNSCLSEHVPKKRGLTVATLFRGKWSFTCFENTQIGFGKLAEGLNKRLETHWKGIAVSSEGWDVKKGSAPSQGNDRHQLLTLSAGGAVMMTNCTQGVVGADDELAHLRDDRTV